MAITVREVSDDEIPRACEIELLAYKGGALSPVLAPGPFPPESWQQRIDQVVNMRKDDPTAVYLQAFDEETGKMVAFAKWHIYETSEAASRSSRPLSFGAGRNKEACMLFFGGMAKRKEELIGNKPHLCKKAWLFAAVCSESQHGDANLSKTFICCTPIQISKAEALVVCL